MARVGPQRHRRREEEEEEEFPRPVGFIATFKYVCRTTQFASGDYQSVLRYFTLLQLMVFQTFSLESQFRRTNILLRI